MKATFSTVLCTEYLKTHPPDRRPNLETIVRLITYIPRTGLEPVSQCI